MPELSDDELDDLLLSFATARLQKVAMIITKAMGVSHTLDDFRAGERIAALVTAGKLESVGDIRQYRCSEVRLPSKPGCP